MMTKIGFQGQFSLNAGQQYCRMLPLEHSAIVLTFIKLPFVIKIFILSIFEWPLKTGFTVLFQNYYEEPAGSVIECLTQDRGVAVSSLTGGTVLWP